LWCLFLYKSSKSLDSSRCFVAHWSVFMWFH
jgi:hypothetical protein